MFQVTTVLPEAKEPISKAKLQTHDKVPKSEEEIKVIEEAKKIAEAEKEAKKAEAAAKAEAEGKKVKKDKKQKAEGPKEEDLFNFTEIPLAEQRIDYKKDMFGKPAFLSVSG